MAKYIKIFLASSIVEFEHQRLELEAYINKLNKIYIRKGIFFELVVCEGLSNALSVKRKQEEYNQEIRDSQFFYILFGREAGEYTIEEFDVALEEFRRTGAPRIYTYFQCLPEHEQGESVKNFMRRLDQELGHYYSVFDHIDSIKLNMLLELTRYSESSGAVKFEEGKATVNGKEVLSLEHVPVYAKNEELNRLKTELEETQKKLAGLAAEFAKDPKAAKVRNQLSETSTRCDELEKAISQMEEQMLKLCSLIAERNSSGVPTTWREKEATRLLNAGDYKGALAILRLADHKKDVDRLKNRAEKMREEAIALIGETKLRIQTLIVDGLKPENMDEIMDCYEEACTLAEEYRVELDMLYDYAFFLSLHRNLNKAVQVAERLKHYYEMDPPVMKEQALLHTLLGRLYFGQNEVWKAEHAYRSAMVMADTMEAEHPSEENRRYVALCRNALASALMQKKEYEAAETLFGDAIERIRGLSDASSMENRLNLADMHSNRAVMFKQMGRFEEAEEGYRLALSQFRQIAEEFPEEPMVMDEEIAMELFNLANLSCEQKKYEEAEQLYRESIKLYEHLTMANPVVYEPMKVGIELSLASLLNEIGRFAEAEELYRKGLSAYRDYTAEDFKAYGPDFANVSGGYGRMQKALGQYEAAEKTLTEALNVCIRLEEWNPGEYSSELGHAYDDLAGVLYSAGQYERSCELTEKSIRIFEALNEKAPETYAGEYATICTNHAANLQETKQYGKARKLYRTALEIYRHLAETDPKLNEGEIAFTECRLAEMFCTQGQYHRAEPEYLEALKIYKKLVGERPEEAEPILAEIYYSLAVITARVHQDVALSRQYLQESLKLCRKYRKLSGLAKEIERILSEK